MVNKAKLFRGLVLATVLSMTAIGSSVVFGTLSRKAERVGNKNLIAQSSTMNSFVSEIASESNRRLDKQTLDHLDSITTEIKKNRDLEPVNKKFQEYANLVSKGDSVKAGIVGRQAMAELRMRINRTSRYQREVAHIKKTPSFKRYQKWVQAETAKNIKAVTIAGHIIGALIPPVVLVGRNKSPSRRPGKKDKTSFPNNSKKNRNTIPSKFQARPTTRKLPVGRRPGRR